MMSETDLNFSNGEKRNDRQRRGFPLPIPPETTPVRTMTPSCSTTRGPPLSPCFQSTTLIISSTVFSLVVSSSLSSHQTGLSYYSVLATLRIIDLLFSLVLRQKPLSAKIPKRNERNARRPKECHHMVKIHRR